MDTRLGSGHGDYGEGGGSKDSKKTPLYSTHLKYGGKMVDFAGWSLPVQFSGIIEEHRAVRKTAGLFDVSHMGEIRIRGDNAERLVQRLICNDISNAPNGKITYSPMCNPNGGVIDDLLVYCFGANEFLLVVNASNHDRDLNWIHEQASAFEDVTVQDESTATAQIAIQGPRTAGILQGLTKMDLSTISYYHFVDGVNVGGISCLVSRTGYTGEDGFELYCGSEDAPELWDVLMEAGQDDGLVPAGLGCRDTLRFEACLPLYGHELDEERTPLEAGLGRFVKLDKGDFIGRDALLKQKRDGVKLKLVGLEMVERGIPRAGYKVLRDGQRIGYITTGGYSPILNKNLGLAFVEPGFGEIGNAVEVDIRGKAAKARIVRTPFYRREDRKDVS